MKADAVWSAPQSCIERQPHNCSIVIREGNRINTLNVVNFQLVFENKYGVYVVGPQHKGPTRIGKTIAGDKHIVEGRDQGRHQQSAVGQLLGVPMQT